MANEVSNDITNDNINNVNIDPNEIPVVTTDDVDTAYEVELTEGIMYVGNEGKVQIVSSNRHQVGTIAIDINNRITRSEITNVDNQDPANIVSIPTAQEVEQDIENS